MDGFEMLEFAVDGETYAIQIRLPLKSRAQIHGIARIIRDVLEDEFGAKEELESAIGFRHPQGDNDGEEDESEEVL